MKIGGGLLTSVFFLLMGLFGLSQSLFFRYWESMILPLSISCCLVVLAGVQIIREIRWNRRNAGTEEGLLLHLNLADVSINLRWLGLTIIWTAAFAMVIFILGFYIAIPVFTLAYLKWRRRSWIAAIVFAGATTVIVYLVFEFLFKVPLFPGLIFGGQF